MLERLTDLTKNFLARRKVWNYNFIARFYSMVLSDFGSNLFLQELQILIVNSGIIKHLCWGWFIEIQLLF